MPFNRKIIRRPRANTAVLPAKTVAMIMTYKGFPMSKSCVEQIEARALFKIHKYLTQAKNEITS